MSKGRREGRRKFWGWGLEGQGPSLEQQRGIAKTLAARFGPGAADAAGLAFEPTPPPTVDEIELPVPRLSPPTALAAICSADPWDRAGHTYGKSFRDVVRGYARDFRPAPDLVAFPRDEEEIAALLDWCSDARAAAIPYGGGSSVVGGVEADVGAGYAGAVSIDLGRLDRVVEIDRSSRAARIQAGVLGPALEDQLRPHGLTLRHFPQSFEFSSLGGWIATRSGGHYATTYTHIEDFLESLRAVTPRGVLESRRLPGSGAGPSPDRMFAGSEGILGIITEAWMRLQDRPSFRAQASVRFPGEGGFLAGARVVRTLSQAGLHPANCRLLDAREAETSGAAPGDASVLIVGFESADHPLDPWMDRALEIARDGGGEVPEGAGRTRTGSGAPRDGAAGAWRSAFLNMPYLRDALVGMGVVSETFETAITWDRFEAFHAETMSATSDAVARICGAGQVACRFTHVYPDGPAPYYSVIAPGRRGSLLEIWADVKAAASEAVIQAGGTITHHHAVGRDHRPWYDAQRPTLFADALRAAKKELDPASILNPRVLLDP